jgi:hypothetical protein
MVAHPGVDVRIPPLTCTPAAADGIRRLRPQRYARPAGTGCRRPLAALCAKYVPKFQASTPIRDGHMHHVGEPVATLPTTSPAGRARPMGQQPLGLRLQMRTTLTAARRAAEAAGINCLGYR